MKKTLQYLIPLIFLIFVPLFLYSIAFSPGKLKVVSIGLSLLVTIFYGIWFVVSLVKTKKVNQILIASYFPVMFFLNVLVIFIILFHPQVRIIKVDLGPDAFLESQGDRHHRNVRFYFWEMGYYFPESQLDERIAEEKAKIQITSRGNLIGHMGTEFQGWPEEKILDVWGEPSSIKTVGKDSEKWIYHPWTNHPDWEMPVYVEHGKLLRIGDKEINL